MVFSFSAPVHKARGGDGEIEKGGERDEEIGVEKRDREWCFHSLLHFAVLLL